MTNPDQQGAANDYQRMMASFHQTGQNAAEKLRDSLDPTARRAIEQGLPGKMADFDRTLPDPMRIAMAHDAVRNLAFWYAAQRADPATALSRAYDGIFGLHYDFDQHLRAPKGELPTIAAAGEAVRSTLTPQMLGPIGGYPVLTPDERRAIYADALPDAYWQTNGLGDGAVLMMPLRNGSVQAVRDYTGHPVGFRYADAPQIAAGRPPPQLPPPQPGAVP